MHDNKRGSPASAIGAQLDVSGPSNQNHNAAVARQK